MFTKQKAETQKQSWGNQITEGLKVKPHVDCRDRLHSKRSAIRPSPSDPPTQKFLQVEVSLATRRTKKSGDARRATQERKGEREKKDQLEAALSFFLIS